MGSKRFYMPQALLRFSICIIQGIMCIYRIFSYSSMHHTGRVPMPAEYHIAQIVPLPNLTHSYAGENIETYHRLSAFADLKLTTMIWIRYMSTGCMQYLVELGFESAKRRKKIKQQVERPFLPILATTKEKKKYNLKKYLGLGWNVHIEWMS